MKLKLEVDMTPEELRRLFGWPDVSKVQNMMLDQMTERMKNADVDTVKNMLKPFVFDGFKPMENYQNIMGNLFKMATKGKVDINNAADDDDAAEDTKE